MKRIALLALCAAFCIPAAPWAQTPPRAQVMIVGVAHLVAQLDVHNSTWGESSLAPDMQRHIREVLARLLPFHPTKVMIEGLATDPSYADRYQSYLEGRYALSSDETDQLGFRLAALAHDPTIYPVDILAGFPFDYDALQASAQRNGEADILARAGAHMGPFIAHMNALEKQDRLLDVLRYLNTPQALAMADSWYMYADRIGNNRGDYAGADLVSYWYARNLHIFANITRNIEPGDRVIIFIGQGHAALLDGFAVLAPDLRFVSPESYLR